MPLPEIAIIGGGPSGLTLARLLQQSSIPFTLYESEPDRHTRDQAGGSLDLHPESGQLALARAGLTKEFERLSRPEAQAFKLVNGAGEVVLDENLASGNGRRKKEFDDRPEIDRRDLRGLLLDSIDEEKGSGRIVWGSKVEKVVEIKGKESKFGICFANGTVEEDFDLVVGADGAWSKVRPLVTDVRPVYSGVTLIDILVKDVSVTQPWLSEYVGIGSCFVFDEGRAVLCQRNSRDCMRVYVCVKRPETWVNDSGIDWSNGQAVREVLEKDYFSSCGKDVRRLIRESIGDLVARPLYMMPVGHRWKSRPGVALLGDAAHVFTPFAGEGVNLAMTDAMKLAEKLIAHKESLMDADRARVTSLLATVVQEYDSEMFERATVLAEKTARGLKGHFEKDGAEDMARRLTEKAPSGS